MTDEQRTRILIIGGIIGVAVGVLGGWLYANSAPMEFNSKTGEKQLAKPSSGQILKVSLGLLTLLRLISAPGE